jgi:hypothetical protein
LRTKASSCISPIFSGVGDLLHGRDVGPGHLVPPDLVLGSLLDHAEHRVELSGLEGCSPTVRIKIGVGREAAGQQLTTAAVERGAHPLAPLDARLQVAGEGQHLLACARAEVVVGGADHAVGAAQGLAERGGQRAAPALQLGLGVVPVVGGQVRGRLGQPVAFQQVADHDQGRQVGDPVLGEEVREPDDRVLLPSWALISCTRRTSSAGKRPPSSKG